MSLMEATRAKCRREFCERYERLWAGHTKYNQEQTQKLLQEHYKYYRESKRRNDC